MDGHTLGESPRANKPGKPLKGVSCFTFVLWPLEGGNWDSFSLRAIAPHADRGEVSCMRNFKMMRSNCLMHIGR